MKLLFFLISAFSATQDVSIRVSIDETCVDVSGLNTLRFDISNNSEKDIVISNAFLFWKLSIKDANMNDVRPRIYINPRKSADDSVSIKRKSTETILIAKDFSRFDLEPSERYTLNLTYGSPKDKAVSKLGVIEVDALAFQTCDLKK